MIHVNGLLEHWGTDVDGGSYGSGEIRAKVPSGIGMKNEILYTWKPGREGLTELQYTMFLIKEMYPDSKNTLIMEYVPNGRLDKPLGKDKENGHLLAPLNRYTAKIINDLGFDEVIGTEPHSAEFFKQYKNSRAEYPTMRMLEMIHRVVGYKQEFQVVFPDHGSYERYKDEIMRKNRYAEDFVIMKKKRIDGVVEELDVDHGELSKTKKKIIIDDVCGTGSTVLKTAKLIQNICGDPKDIFVLVAFLEQSVERSDDKKPDGWVLSEESPISKIIVCGPSIFEKVRNKKVIYIDYDYEKPHRIETGSLATILKI